MACAASRRAGTCEATQRREFRACLSSQQDDGALSFNPEERVATWPITAYGKTPTAFLQTDEEAVNLAAVVALRDAGAHFVTTFGANPGVATWLDGIAARQHNGIGPEPDVEGAEGSPNISGDDAATWTAAAHDDDAAAAADDGHDDGWCGPRSAVHGI